MYKNAVLYFVAVTLVLLIGFWPSYYSKLFGDLSFGQHFHGMTMSLWCLLLISQAWLMRAGKRDLHRKLGKVSFVLGPMVIIAAFFVAFDFIARVTPPYSTGVLAIHWFGLFLAGLFSWLFAMGLYHRKTPRLHATYMACTALVFLIPGLGRLVGQLARAGGFDAPPFAVTMAVPALIGLIMLARIPHQRTFTSPVALFTMAWVANVVLYLTLPKFQWWVEFTAWSATLLA